MAHILIIDDTNEICEFLQSVLEKKEHMVCTAENGVKGLKLARENKFDIVITDIFMPEKDGLETIRALKAKNKNIKIIAMSGGSPYDYKVDYLDVAKKLGADYRINKPINEKELLTIIGEKKTQ